MAAPTANGTPIHSRYGRALAAVSAARYPAQAAPSTASQAVSTSGEPDQEHRAARQPRAPLRAQEDVQEPGRALEVKDQQRGGGADEHQAGGRRDHRRGRRERRPARGRRPGPRARTARRRSPWSPGRPAPASARGPGAGRCSRPAPCGRRGGRRPGSGRRPAGPGAGARAGPGRRGWSGRPEPRPGWLLPPSPIGLITSVDERSLGAVAVGTRLARRRRCRTAWARCPAPACAPRPWPGPARG
jgi:hypothetical protein